ncbi:DUF3034 family protein [Granulosicoccus sp. 3-233]|uniref:DUF3034 family protein n=1 Tax=Granulosicoccus sp. 3-233 TaxID=3417969 RepID=UPI003D32930E
MTPIIRTLLSCLILTAFAHSAQAEPGGRLIATGGAMSVEGTAGGGIVPWALLAGYGEDQQFGGTAWYTQLEPDDFSLQAYGAALTLHNRVELSIGKQRFDIDQVVAGEELEQTIIGAKWRLSGDLIYSRMPQLSLGLQYKKNDAFAVPELVGARDDNGLDVYLAASKLWLDGPFHRSLFLNATLRATKANQAGLLGFGGDQRNRRELVGELSAGLFLTREWVVGMEYRQKPDNLGFAKEDDWYDVFVGWFPSKRVSLVAAWSDLGSIAGFEDQTGLYVSLQVSQ